MMLVPLSAGMVLVRDERHLTQAFSQRAPYLFHEGDRERGWDQGPRSFACSRRFDALKLWVALHRYGSRGIGTLFDHLSDLAGYLAARLHASGLFEVLHAPECNILCFRWHQGSMAPDATNQFNRQLRERYNASGEGWITTTMLDDTQVLRVTIMNPRTTEAHLDRLVEGLIRAAGTLAGAAGGAPS